MSENTEQPTSEQEQVSATDTEQLGDGGKKALEAERAARKEAEKQIRELSEKVSQFEDAGKSEAEKQEQRMEQLAAELAAATAAKSELEHRLLISEVVSEVGLPAELAERLRGDDRDALLEDAKQLKELLAPGGPRKPAPVPEAGAARGGSRSNADVFSDVLTQAFNN